MRGAEMQKWLDSGLILIGAAITAWALIQNHDYRISQLEDSLESHKEKHEQQAKEIDLRLSRIELAIGRIETKLEDRR